QLRKISVTIHHSPTLLLPAWERAVEIVKLKLKKLPRDVRTRWNSTFRMLDVALEYRMAIERMTDAQANNLRRWELDEREWEIARQLRDILQVSSHFVGEDAPTLTDVIPSMDIIDERLATDTTNAELDPAIRIAIGCAKRTINHYYDKSDESAAYRISMSEYCITLLYACHS
ncbi:hypothetical protein FOMPIDRAFT_64674, partial [Fomitopsis schrenkii]